LEWSLEHAERIEASHELLRPPQQRFDELTATAKLCLVGGRNSLGLGLADQALGTTVGAAAVKRGAPQLQGVTGGRYD
jgi:hypothetical protein